MVASDRRWALMHELRDHAAPTPQQLMARLSPCDLVLVEGWKSWPIPKFEVHRPALGKPALYPHDPHIVAVGSDAPLVCPLPCLDLARIEEIAAVIFSEALELSR
jgi:molybdopterin-guanine dinucleotide biosynthesis protein B